MWKFVVQFSKEILSHALHKSRCQDKSTITSSSPCLHQTQSYPQCWSESRSLQFGLVRYLIPLLTQTLELLSGRAYRVCCELKMPALSVIRIAYEEVGKHLEQLQDYGIKRMKSVCACCDKCVTQESESVRQTASTSCFSSDIYR